MIRNQKIKGTFICGPLFFKWMGIFQSWLDCFSIGVWAFIHYSKYKLFHLQKSLYAGVHLLQFLNALTCSPITLFFKCIKLHQILSLFSTINLAYVLEINISFVTIFKCSSLQFHYSFFQVQQIASYIVPILHNKPSICTGD